MKGPLEVSNAPRGASTALAQHRITRLAGLLPVHRAFHWMHLHGPQLRSWQMEVAAIPAPTFAEGERAEWFLERFRTLGLGRVGLDGAGNALGVLGEGPRYLLLSAHLDTVFPAGTDTLPIEDGDRILGPGVCDNGAGLTGLLAVMAALQYAGIVPAMPILFAANVGEEGEGDLRGMRQLFGAGEFAGKIAAAVALEGAGTAAAVTRGLGSRRFRITVSGPGGHSWSDAGVPNPILLVARALASLPVPAADAEPRTTLSAGRISGGTSINSIPSTAVVDLDLRSTSAAELVAWERMVRQAFAEAVDAAGAAAALEIAVIGDRPAASLADDAPLLDTLRAVDRHLGLRTELRLGSTDANWPLSLGVPAVALAAGGTGGGIHTLGEWYDPTGREMALRRVLLTVLDLAGSFTLGG